MAKRKAEETAAPSSPVKKGKPSKASSPAPAPAPPPVDVKSSFRKGLFDKAVEAQYREEYASSTPYAAWTLSNSHPAPPAPVSTHCNPGWGNKKKYHIYSYTV